MKLCDKLARLKSRRGLTTDALSQKSGVPKGTINKVLNGETRNPTIATLKALAEALDCPLDWLSGEGGPPRPGDIPGTELGSCQQESIFVPAFILGIKQGFAVKLNSPRVISTGESIIAHAPLIAFTGHDRQGKEQSQKRAFDWKRSIHAEITQRDQLLRHWHRC